MATAEVPPNTEGGAVDAEVSGASVVEQTEPTPTSAPAEAAEPIQAAEPEQQAEPAQQAEPVQQSEPVQQAEPVQQSEPVQQAEPVQQVEPVQQAESEVAKLDSPAAPVPAAPAVPAVLTGSAVVPDAKGGIVVADGVGNCIGEGDMVTGESAEELTDAHRATLEIAEKRIERLLAENAAMCGEYAQVSKDLHSARAAEEDLEVAWQAASNMKVRQKMVAQSHSKSAQNAGRTELQRATEAAQQLFELKEVHSQMMSVNRQLVFAVELQARSLAELGHRAAAKARNIQRLELALYRVIAHAQGVPGLEEAVSALVSRCGPLVHGALSREAQRRALQLTAPQAA